MIKKAIEIAEKAFEYKKDKAGKPYLGHLERVMKGVENEVEEIKVVAMLHDLLEDCPEWSKEKLLEFFPETVVQAIVCMTHQTDQNYDDYISQIQTNEWAKAVKISDLKDNMDITRLAVLSEKDIERLKKYHRAYWRLVN
jgi:(p)ppGpp synthase/HD superfamily hydrolase